MIPVVEAPRAGSDVLEVNLALVTHAVHVGGPRCPRHMRHAATRLRVPAPDVRHFADLSFPTCTMGEAVWVRIRISAIFGEESM